MVWEALASYMYPSGVKKACFKVILPYGGLTSSREENQCEYLDYPRFNVP